MNNLFLRCAVLLASVYLLLSTGCRRDPIGRAINAIERNNPALAESLLAELAETTTDDPSVHANLAIARMKLGQTDAALAGFRRAADLAPSDPRPLEFMAAIATSDNRWRMCMEVLFEAERRDPRSPRLQTALAIAELRISGPQAARTRLLQVLGSAPNYSPAMFNLGVIMKDHLSSPKEAAVYFERYLAISGDQEHKTLAREAITQLQANQTVSPPATTTTDMPVARINVTPAPAKVTPPQVATTPRQGARRPQAAVQAYNNGVRDHNNGNLDRAIEHYALALRVDPTMATAHYNLGLIFRQQKKAGEARQAFQQAFDLDPAMADARYMLALVLREQGQVDAAIEHLRALLNQSPSYAQAHHALGLIFSENQSTISQARHEFEKYIELTPEGPYAQLARDWLKVHR